MESTFSSSPIASHAAVHKALGVRDIIDSIGVLLVESEDGGLMSPSIYDTAMGVYYAEGRSIALSARDWLLAQQRPDGGWGDPDAPLYRDAPTLASILALHNYRESERCQDAAIAGCAFLRRTSARYRRTIPADAPVGIELVLPRLCEEAEKAGLPICVADYPALVHSNERRLKILKEAAPSKGHAVLHSWEGWGSVASASQLDDVGSVGSSPAATAAWLHQAHNVSINVGHIRRAKAYLDRASRATQSGVRGVLPVAWPIDIFEPAWMLYTLGLCGLLQHPGLIRSTRGVAERLRSLLTKQGIGFTQGFEPDGDDTAVVLSVLAMMGCAADINPLLPFVREGHAITFRAEHSPSLSTSIHALHALHLYGAPATRLQQSVIQQSNEKGVYAAEKWHVSWLYSTAHAVAALGTHGDAQRMAQAILMSRHAEGGWGYGSSPTMEETGYALFSLATLAKRQPLSATGREALHRASGWVMDDRSMAGARKPLWVDKELYCPYRVTRIVELTGQWIAYGGFERCL